MPFIPKPAVEPPLIVTLDVGTSSVRAFLFDRLGRGVEGVEGRRAYEMRTTPDGGPDRHERYQRALERQQELYNLLVSPKSEHGGSKGGI